MVIMTAKVPKRRLLLIVLLLIAAAVVLALCLRGRRNGKARENRHAGRNERGAHRLPRELRLAGRAGAGQDPAGHRPG